MDSRSRTRSKPQRSQRYRSTSRPRMDSRSRARETRKDSRSRSNGMRGSARSRSRGRGNPQPAYRIPPPAKRADPKKEATITEEQRQNSIPLDGYLYATIDFTSPQAQPPWTTEPDARYTYQTKTDISVIRAKNLPSGWEVAPATEAVIREVIKPHAWGTHLLVTEGCKAYWTAGGNNPGCLEALWDYEKLPGRYTLKAKFGQNAALHGIILIKTISKVSQ
ncbi:unnamed protein product [Symbiodinium natans]|uniref:Uncharacterized protein n=1 Tax=Symbiodinium natans TaxID=878477 RepID=A0A812SFC2_9DINO|nr:unnamed protein product [Symbiodinium natans]